MQAYNVQNVVDLETVGSDADTNLVVQLDVGQRCDRYLLQKADAPSDKIMSRPLESTGPINMSHPQTLAEFLIWGVTNFPAKHYLVVMSDHGEGWQGAMQDDSHHGWMSLPQMGGAFAQAQRITGRKIDVIGFDACLMASTEVAHELRDHCNYLVASEESEGASGWPYGRILNHTLLQSMQRMHQQRITVDMGNG